MSNEKVEGSPLARRKMVLGASQPEAPQQETELQNIKTLNHKDIKALEHKEVKKLNSEVMKRTTVYMPDELAMRFKVYAARHREDMSSIIVKFVENLA